MHGSISLESTLGVGTKASFWIPFNKAPYDDDSSPLISLGSIPDRLQSDLSISCDSSGEQTPPTTPAVGNRDGGHVRSGSTNPHPGTPTGEAASLTDSERKDVNVLVVEDNAVNQQIAIKTIKKLGFSVNAVWNGQEALQYLERDASETRPDPDIVLMDVQMPILDGYKATKILRSQEPYQNKPSLRDLPIVAMTASAIQGDREKCQKAGMDDYLAKPVKSKVLEKMLVKWAIERKQKRQQVGGRNTRNRPHPPRGLSGTTGSSSEELQNEPSTVQHHPGPSTGEERLLKKAPEDVDTQLDRIDFKTTTALATSTADESHRSFQRELAEEKAASLRDDKLLQTTENPRLIHRSSGMTQQWDEEKAKQNGPRHALTLANVQRLTEDSEKHENRNEAQDQMERPKSSSSMAVADRGGSSSSNAGGAGQVPLRGGTGAEQAELLRPRLEKWRNDSERTVTRNH